MKTNSITKIAVTAGLMVALLGTQAFADGRRWGGDRYHHSGDHWCKVGWFGFGAAVGALTVGAMVESLPPRHTTVIVGSDAYYYYDGAYFRPAPCGYVVVPAPVARPPVVVVPPPAPVVVATPAPVAVIEPMAPVPLAVTVNIPNTRGSYTGVTLQRSGSGFIGPQGEYYPEFPKVEQLRMMYGQ